MGESGDSAEALANALLVQAAAQGQVAALRRRSPKALDPENIDMFIAATCGAMRDFILAEVGHV
jgi:hypothetical protein